MPTLFTKIEFWAHHNHIWFHYLLLSSLMDSMDQALLRITLTKNALMMQGLSSLSINTSISRNLSGISGYTCSCFAQLCNNPTIFNKESVLRNVGFLVLIFAATVIIFGIAGTYLLGHLYGTGRKDETDQSIFLEDGVFDSFKMLFVLAIYTAIKYGGIYLYNVSETSRQNINLSDMRRSLQQLFGW